jgi:hypothetical protein
MPIWPDGGFPIGDVRDAAVRHADVLTRGGPARVAVPGRFVTTRELLRALRGVTGRRLPAVHLPASALLPVGRVAGLVQRVLPGHVPVEYGAIYACKVGRPLDDAPTGRPLAETLADTVRWLHEAGHLSAAQAGSAANREPVGR